MISNRALPGLATVVCLFAAQVATAQEEEHATDELNRATNVTGYLPTDEDGNELNLDFERGNLDDWEATGTAFDDQPVEGGIDPNRPFGADKSSDHTGDHWVGGYEFHLDPPQGTLTSKPFRVSKPFASFLLAGGSHFETRVEIVHAESGRIILSASGINIENLRPVIVDLRSLMDETIFVRIVDAHSGGWGHVNFDDFRVYDARPRFQVEPLAPRQDLQVVEVYPHAGLEAEVAAEVMQLPPGFSVQVGAQEPDVNQPIAMALDDRGRVWIAEAYEYPQRAPEGEGTDRILIFEDTDGNGSLDSRKVFAEGLNLVSGLEVGFDGVFVGAAPYLLFIPDRDHDDRPDSEPEILLDGWGYEDTHETLNAFIWGPDGWLYGCHGVFTHSRVGKPGTPDEERVPINAGIWRYHPVNQSFEVFAHGTSNPWGVDFDDYGQAFATACVIPHLFHIIQGARYQRQAGVHFNPHTYDDIKTIAEHRHFVGNQWNDNDRKRSDDLGGGHAHAGAMVYLGGAWPEEYRNQLFMNNIHGNRLNVDQLTSRGSGYVGNRAPDFLLTGDQWSQMINMRYGPDGQVWIIDWYDANQCHHRDEDAHDRTNGRIFRVVYDDAPNVVIDLRSKSDLELIEYQSDSNDWYVRHARRLLQERAASGELSEGSRELLQERLSDESSIERRLRLLWCLHVTGGVPQPVIEGSFSAEDPRERAWIVQLAMESCLNQPPDELLERLVQLAEHDPSPIVRLYLASAATRLPVSQRWQLVEHLAGHPEDAGDHNLPLMYWYAMEPLAEVDPQLALAVAVAAGRAVPVLREMMIRRLGHEDPNSTLGLFVAGLTDADELETQLTFLRGINESLAGRQLQDAPDEWKAALLALRDHDHLELRLRVWSASMAFGESGRQSLIDCALDENQPTEARVLAIKLIAQSHDPQIGDATVDLVADRATRGAVLTVVSRLAGDSIPLIVTEHYDDLTLDQKRLVIGSMLSRAETAAELLDLVEQQKVPRSDLTADIVRRIRGLGDATLDSRLATVWGVVRDSDATAAERIETYRRLIHEVQDAVPDLELGRAVFARTCQQCHTLFASGGAIGPDLTGSNRKDLDYLLSNVLDPSAVMANEYQSSIVLTVDGRVLSGIVREVAGGRIEVVNETETLTLELADVEEITATNESMMPQDLLSPLRNDEIRALVAYLAADGQTPLLARPDNVNGFFNEVDLQGWVGDAELWRVENGEIVGVSEGLDRNHFLVSEMSFRDFRFSCDVKLENNQGNSGIQFRSRPSSGGEVSGYQADIGVGWWGKLYEEHGRGLLVAEGGESFVEAGQWNRYEIVAVGSRVQTFLNGQPCVDYDDPLGARQGVIAFQLHSGGPMEVRFRNLQIELIEAPDKLAAFRSSIPLEENEVIRFEKRRLDDIFRSEGVAVADLDNDGDLDIAAGSVWFSYPDWTSHSITKTPLEFDPKSYSNSFSNFADDINGDGRADIVVIDFPGQETWWFENPGDTVSEWTRRTLTSVTNNESPAFVDLNDDGKRELVFGSEGGRMSFATPQSHLEAVWKLNPISAVVAPGTDRFSHGLGVGDINQDGRLDVLVTQGWWEAPRDDQGQPWLFHDAPFGEACSHMHVYDFDGDGDQDVVSSSAHQYGIWWHEQTAEGWQSHEIESSFSQTHSLCLADMNGDGLPDLVTGKRFWAHNGNDPGGNEDAVLYWFELSRVDGRPQWTPHLVDHDSGVGTQFEVADVNRDGLLDIVTSNKKGVFYFEQSRAESDD